MQDNNEPLPAEVLAALQQGELVAAVRILRTKTGLGLKDAKDAIDAYLAGQATPAFKSGAAVRRQVDALSPGEVPRSGTGWWLAAFVCAVIAAYFFL